MGNTKLDSAIQRAREAAGLATDAAIIANDGLSPYGVTAGYMRVQVRHGANYQKAIEVPNHTRMNPTPGTSVRLGKKHGTYGIVDIDAEAIRVAGGNPSAVALPDENAVGYVNQGNIPVLKVIPQSPPSTTLVVLPLWVERPTGLSFFAGEGIDLSSDIGALSTGEHQLVGIFLKPDNTIERTLSTAKNTADPLTSEDVAECYAARTSGGLLGSFWRITEATAAINSDQEFLDARQYINIPPSMHSTANVSSPPTDAELDSAFGAPADVGAGFMGTVDDNGAGTAGYIVWSDGANWFYVAGTKAT